MCASSRFPVPDWHRANAAAARSAGIRAQPEDFQVDEILDFQPTGDGEHDFLRIEKSGCNTLWVARQLGLFAGIPERDVGYAGMKDRHAVTRQWFSVRRPSGQKADWSAFECKGVRIIDDTRHARKLKRGAHAGNRFSILLRDFGETTAIQAKRLEHIGVAGVPNYFGEQRFGRDAANLVLASDFFAGRRMSRAKRSIALSSARAFLFNHILDQRVSEGSWDCLKPGDCASLQGSNSIFPVTTVDADLERRCRSLDVHPSGALWGSGELVTLREVAHLEQSVADRFAELRDGLQRHARHGRRALRLKVQDLSWQSAGDSLRLEFFLVSGGFATAVLREIARYEDRSHPHKTGGAATGAG